jgi:hypothetical protein
MEAVPLTKEDIRRAIFSTSPHKAPGIDGIPSIVWQELWPVLQDQLLALFQNSLEQAYLPQARRVAKIVPLRKGGPNRDYRKSKSYRPISLLATLGKIMEAVLAGRISYLVEEHDLLPKHHYGARKRRSTIQAVLWIVQKIYDAWREGKVFSLITFDVKGAYNGVAKDVLLHRLRERRIPENWVKWIEAFCSGRKATILVNGETSRQTELFQAGLPQGSPLSPILFLFFNANLLQGGKSRKLGSSAFVDDYTAWVTGNPSRTTLDSSNSV